VKASTALDKAIQGPEYQIFWNILKTHAQQPVPLTANMYQEGVDILNAVEATELGHSVTRRWVRSSPAPVSTAMSKRPCRVPVPRDAASAPPLGYGSGQLAIMPRRV